MNYPPLPTFNYGWDTLGLLATPILECKIVKPMHFISLRSVNRELG
jgi:hypothetical protein